MKHHRRVNNPILEEIKRFLDENGVRGKTVICAFSGGADSLLLLWMLHSLGAARDNRVCALHVNHGIRGEEAKRDEAFCRDFCLKYDIPFYSEHVDALAFAEEEKVSIETAARILRYRVFDTYSKRYDALIATAHTADDQAETVLFRLARGTGLAGLGGIPPVREHFIRPLLRVTAKQVRDELARLGLPHMEDSTNTDETYSRNYIRHEILPRCEALHTGAALRMAKTAELVREDEEYLYGEAMRFLSKTEKSALRSALSELHPVLARRVIRILYERVRISPDALTLEQTEAVLTLVRSRKRYGTVDLPAETRAVCDGELFRVEKREEEQAPPTIALTMGENPLPAYGGCLILSDSPIALPDTKPKNIYNSVISVSFSSARIIGNLYVRPRREGDSYRFCGMTRKLKKLLNDAKMSHAARLRLPVICDDAGILWVPGFGVRDGEDTGDNSMIYACFATREVTSD
ncbi:MAG: tRNA lysidine(34) synthetase TilS [Clostridia bacterium]|nr:tRNA lysidine(34) synthetase TilS [Clostridia bacterium]MDY6184589.1 tRNA lysidine(34) synthetase TilS [Eubacteriales bacterium]